MKNGNRHRQYSIVIHDVPKGFKDIIQTSVQELQPDWSLVAEEEYNHQDGNHIHVFIKYNQVKAFKPVLNFFKKKSEEHKAGRVQVDIGRGNFEECKKYLISPDKNKNIDIETNVDVRKLSRQEVNARLATLYPDETQPCIGCSIDVYVGPSNWSISKNSRRTIIYIEAECPDCLKKKSQGILNAILPSSSPSDQETICEEVLP